VIMRKSAAVVAAALCGAALVAACSSNSSGGKTSGSGSGSTTPSAALGGGFGTVPAEATGAQHAGVITWAEAPDTGPTWILPIVTSAADSYNDIDDFEWLLWRPLYWFQNGVEPTLDPALSLANAPVWSNGDKTVTITMKSNYKWNDGTPVTAQDVLFDFDEIKAAVGVSAADYGPYSPGVGIPDQVASASAPNSTTLVLNLKSAVNPGWFWDDQLSTLNPLPIQAWARDSANGPLLNYAVPANATKIYNFLAAQSGKLNTYVTNPLWHTVDGPYTLSAFNASTGAYTMAPNQSYGGPHAKTISTLQAVPYTSDTAEFNAVRSGAVDLGYLPLDDVKQVGSVKAAGYNVFGYPGFFFNYIAYNFDDTTGDFNHIIGQLYIRQALAHLEDEAGYIKAFMGGAGGQAYGPIPQYPLSPYTPSDATTDPYPYSVSTAISILKNHGWTVNAGGTDVCSSAGTGANQCGAGIPAGTKLSFNMYYAPSLTTLSDMDTAYVSAALQAGINIQLKSSNYNYIITYYDNPTSTGKPYINKWATEDFGGFFDSTYPTTQGIFDTNGAENEGSYSDSQANTLISNSVNDGNPSAVKSEASYLTIQQPGLFQPDIDTVVVWKNNISGPQDAFSTLTQYYIYSEEMFFTGTASS
jgi:peptide/nickel transport system substrate-binding protein